ncbi:MAG: SPOR domain-containing protein [Candidatus Neomarinimicrobiota bacterium]|jgi:hypothetical protein|nr:SPOR domain-containing protein [Candidatus Neomarinimicrobiota bacterium]MEC9437577.1 SPOR domain-containing protein [Candidatus Neomarinimicrobiota bacterium]MED5433324.1 SPOR domain-containing protein [Candidatus Neomarinimicrobiota bacterium]|tara:strand:- start:3297 stop:3725 length:429 start_codon:yes stop_codon:yes gene_type:complete
MKTIFPILFFSLIYSQNKKIDFNPQLLNDPEPQWPQIMNPLSSLDSKTISNSTSDSLLFDIEGFRVQVFATQDRNKAENVKKDLEIVNGEAVYIIFEAPNYKVRIGNFLDRDGAEKLRQELVKQNFPSSWIVRTRIQPESEK